MGNSIISVLGEIYIDTAATLVTTGKTVMVDAVVWFSDGAGDDLKLTDINDLVFVETKVPANGVFILPFPKPRELNGLKCATIDGGVCIVYLARP